jgi:PPK2 family polyphosphate:nucleotide phosphotransferase
MKPISAVLHGEKFRLNEISTKGNSPLSKNELEIHLETLGKKLSKIQDVMYAHGKYGVLIVIQGMDTSGKDGLIRDVFKHFNPRGTVVHSFKTPTIVEHKHDFLWRHYLALPERGKFSIFNRSHYENVLVTRVNPEYLMSENLPDVLKPEDATENFWNKRLKQIRHFENHIVENGFLIFKFFLHISKEEQKKRLLNRLNDSQKHWKFSESDLKSRKQWDSYQKCYEMAISATSTTQAPWFIIPADNKAEARYLVAEILLNELKKIKDIKEPELTIEELSRYDEFRRLLNES